MENIEAQAGHIMSYIQLKHITNVARLGLCYSYLNKNRIGL